MGAKKRGHSRGDKKKNVGEGSENGGRDPKDLSEVDKRKEGRKEIGAIVASRRE